MSLGEGAALCAAELVLVFDPEMPMVILCTIQNLGVDNSDAYPLPLIEGVAFYSFGYGNMLQNQGTLGLIGCFFKTRKD